LQGIDSPKKKKKTKDKGGKLTDGKTFLPGKGASLEKRQSVEASIEEGLGGRLKNLRSGRREKKVETVEGDYRQREPKALGGEGTLGKRHCAKLIGKESLLTKGRIGELSSRHLESSPRGGGGRWVKIALLLRRGKSVQPRSKREKKTTERRGGAT